MKNNSENNIKKLGDKMKHTKGPWKISYSVANGALTTYAVNKKSVDHDQAKANANLIAAAPEMLEALYSALDLIENELVNGVVTDKIEAAIKKARGEL